LINHRQIRTQIYGFLVTHVKEINSQEEARN
jgi:hypothetical protein